MLEGTQLRFATFLLDRIEAKLDTGDVEEVKLFVKELRAVVTDTEEPAQIRVRKPRKANGTSESAQ